MTDDQTPPTPLPPAAQAPWPAHPAPHGAVAPSLPVARKTTPPPAMGVLGATLIGGAVAAAVGLFVALPLFRRRQAEAAKPAPRRRGRPRKPKS